MIVNYIEHGFKITARKLPEACTACPFWNVNMKTFESGACYITGHEIVADGPQDKKRMDDCPISKEAETYGLP